MNRLPLEKRAQILGMMVEGMSIRSIVRMTGASKNTVAKLLVDAGLACSDYQDRAFRELPCKKLQLDEIWSFVGAKEKNVPPSAKAWVSATSGPGPRSAPKPSCAVLVRRRSR